MRHKIRLILLFYRSFALLSILITGVMTWLVYKQGGIMLSPAMSLKAITLGLSYYLIRENGTKTRYYYTNQGLTPKVLWAASISFDLILFFICIITGAIIHYHR